MPGVLKSGCLGFDFLNLAEAACFILVFMYGAMGGRRIK